MFVALRIQHVRRIAHIVICGLSGYYNTFATLSHKRHRFRKKVLNIKRVFWLSLQLLSETFLILSRTERRTVINVSWSSCTVTGIHVKFKLSLKFQVGFSKNNQISWKFFQWEPSCSMRTNRTDRRTDTTLHDHPSCLCCPDALSMVGASLSGNGCGSPIHI